METGVLDPLVNAWLGKEVGNERPDLEDTKLVLGGGQLVLIFFVLSGTVVCSLAVLICEFIYSKRKNLQNTFSVNIDLTKQFINDGVEAVR